jgi:hypothetical protein
MKPMLECSTHDISNMIGVEKQIEQITTNGNAVGLT